MPVTALVLSTAPALDTLTALHADLDKAAAEFVQIGNEGADLYRKIDLLVQEYAHAHDCDATYVMERIDAAIADLVDDATGPSYRRKVKIENDIAERELDAAESREFGE